MIGGHLGNSLGNAGAMLGLYGEANVGLQQYLEVQGKYKPIISTGAYKLIRNILWDSTGFLSLSVHLCLL